MHLSNMPVSNLGEENVSPAAPAAQPVEVTPMFTLRELVRFISIVAAILLSANTLVCWTWSYFFGLPGNPISTQVTFHCFAELFLRTLAGEPAPARSRPERTHSRADRRVPSPRCPASRRAAGGR